MSKIINKPIGIRCADIYLRFPEIMEDECNDLAEFLEDEHIVYEGATDIFIDQKNKLDKQKEVLDKIKEYLEELLSDTKGIINDLEYHKEAHKKELELLYDDKDIFNNILELLEEIE